MARKARTGKSGDTPSESPRIGPKRPKTTHVRTGDRPAPVEKKIHERRPAPPLKKGRAVPDRAPSPPVRLEPPGE